jgi:hypothetical protein
MGFLWFLKTGGSIRPSLLDLTPRRPLFSTEGVERAEYGHGHGATRADYYYFDIIWLVVMVVWKPITVNNC